jgi:hypothetical protein
MLMEDMSINKCFFQFEYHMFYVLYPFLIYLLTFPRRCEDNTETNLKEIGLEGVNWFHLAQDSEQWLPVLNAF